MVRNHLFTDLTILMYSLRLLGLRYHTFHLTHPPMIGIRKLPISEYQHLEY